MGEDSIDPGTSHYSDVIFSDDRFVAIGDGGVAVSVNGRTWEFANLDVPLTQIAYGNGRYMAIGRDSEMEVV